MNNPTAYPLQWPPGWPRTANHIRQRWPQPVKLAAALKELQTELRLLGVTNVVLSSDITLGRETAPDPGVVAYGVRKNQPIGIPCDRWITVAANVRAIAKTVNAMRGMSRWGAPHMITAMFHGFRALPAPEPESDWRIMFDNPATVAEMEARYRELARVAHPDKGGSHEAILRLNAAREQARIALGK